MWSGESHVDSDTADVVQRCDYSLLVNSHAVTYILLLWCTFHLRPFGLTGLEKAGDKRHEQHRKWEHGHVLAPTSVDLHQIKKEHPRTWMQTTKQVQWYDGGGSFTDCIISCGYNFFRYLSATPNIWLAHHHHHHHGDDRESQAAESVRRHGNLRTEARETTGWEEWRWLLDHRLGIMTESVWALFWALPYF